MEDSAISADAILRLATSIPSTNSKCDLFLYVLWFHPALQTGWRCSFLDVSLFDADVGLGCRTNLWNVSKRVCDVSNGRPDSVRCS